MNIIPMSILSTVLLSAVLFTSCESNAAKSKKINDKAEAENEAKDYKKSLADYKMAIALDSTNGTAFEGKGSVEYQLNNYDTALMDEFTALRLTPSLKNVYNWIGVIKLKLGDYRGSIEYYNKSIEIGGDANDYVGRGAAEYHLGDYDKAIQDETKGIQLDDKVENGYYWRALIKEVMGDYNGSIDDHTKSLAMGGNNGMDYEDLAADENHLKDNAKALEYINRAIAADTSLKNAFSWRGHIKYDMGDYNGAISDYASSIKKRGNNMDDIYTKALAEYHVQDYADALTDINMAIQLGSTDQVSYDWKEAIEKELAKKK
jgi:tetratricopeptide (TPR) repeat protein